MISDVSTGKLTPRQVIKLFKEDVPESPIDSIRSPDASQARSNLGDVGVDWSGDRYKRPDTVYETASQQQQRQQQGQSDQQVRCVTSCTLRGLQ
jgi:hypothetical protein